MTENRLNIIKIDTEEETPSSYRSKKTARRKEMQAKFERLWLTDPAQFDPLRNCMERERIERTWELVGRYVDLSKHPTIVDIGCGSGLLSRRLRDAGGQVEAIDIAENALKKFIEEGAQQIALKQGAMPETPLQDQRYELVVCTDLIAEIPKEDYRLFFAELARVIQPDGYLVCSSPIDIETEGGVERLQGLAQSEFDLVAEKISYHALYLRVKRMLAAPALFAEGWKNRAAKEAKLSELNGFMRGWYWLNTIPPLAWFWRLATFIIAPARSWLKNSRMMLLGFEKASRFLFDRDGISHYIFVAKRRPLPMITSEERPFERPKKREVWE